jgi:predicted RND superfamily exporter protein
LSVAVSIVGGVLLRPEIDTSFQSMMEADVQASVYRLAFLEAMGDQTSARRLSGASTYALFDLSILYELRRPDLEDDILSQDALEEAAGFEGALRNLGGFRSLCSKAREDHIGMCSPGLSVANYRLADRITQDGIVVQLVPDGSGKDLLPLEASFDMLERHELPRIVFPLDFELPNSSSEMGQVAQLRTQFRFKIPIDLDSGDFNALRKEWTALVDDEIFPFLWERQELQRDEDSRLLLNVWFDGTNIQDMQVMDQLRRDLLLAVGSLSVVFVYMTFHTGSPLLVAAGLSCVVTAIPCAYVVFFLIKGFDASLGIVSFLALFVIVGFGTDNIFVYTDFWHDSWDHIEDRKAASALIQRLSWTYRNAGKATFATTFTTSLSFFANLASTLKPLREFGLFMGLCVVMVWILVSLVYVPVCLIEERKCKGCWNGNQCRHSSTTGLRRGVSLLESLAEKLYQCRAGCCFIPFALAVMSGYFAIANFKLDTSFPSLFPEEHNFNHAQLVQQNFDGLSGVLPLGFDAPPAVEQVCSEAELSASVDLTGCVLFWCEAANNAVDGSCECFRNATEAGDCEVDYRMVGIGDEDLDAAVAAVASELSVPDGALQVSSGPSVLIADWVTGQITVNSMTSVLGTRPSAVGSCTSIDHRVCYCGSWACDGMPAGMVQESLAYGRRLSADRGTSRYAYRRLSADRYSLASHAEVEVVLGISVEGEPALVGKNGGVEWKFIDNFDMAQPWTQRDLRSLCNSYPETLQVHMSFCWIDDFKNFVEAKGDQFPVPYSRFTNLFSEFIDRGTAESRKGPVAPGHYVWMDGDRVKACFLVFELDMDSDAKGEEALAEKRNWDSFLEDFRMDASDYTAGAFQTSELWVRVEAQRALIYSTAATLLTVFVLSFLSMFIVTKNAYLAIFVTASTIGVINGLGFVVVMVLQWEVGAVEVISLIVFVGYALDYSLHIVQKYGTNTQRIHSHAVADYRSRTGGTDDFSADGKILQKQRVTYALTSIGTAAVGSAITTLGSAVFLLFTTLTIFKDIGIMLLITTLLSIFTALVPLPAALLLCGPGEPKDHVSALLRLGPRLWRRCVGMVRRSPDKAREIPDEPQGDTLSGNKDWSQRKEVTVGLQSFQPSNDRMLEVESRSTVGASTSAVWVHVPKHVMLEAV